MAVQEHQTYQVWIILLLCGMAMFLIYQSEVPIFENKTYIYDYQVDLPNVQEGFLIKTEGCRIPYMDPFDSSIKKFIQNETVPNCNAGKPPLFDSNYEGVFLVNSSISAYFLQNESIADSSCCYSVVRRIVPKKHKTESMEVSKTCTKIARFDQVTVIEEEFIKVKCTYNNNNTNKSGAKIYEDYFSFVPIKSSSGNSNLKEGELNVVILGLDAVSRVNFLRQMPKTVQYLNNISAISLLGYNKVGDNTYPNLIPVFTGLNESQLNCWKDGEHFDDCTFIWDDFKWEGYLTSYSEDSAWMGIFNYAKEGFAEQPTDYFWSAFNKFVESRVGNEHKMNVDQCVGSRQVYKTLLEYVDKFIVRLNQAGKKYFSFNWGASLSHDILNMPKIGDETYYQFFKKLKEGNQLENTVFIFMSDHGIRWGDIRETFQGRMEERLPFVYIILPDWFKNKHAYAYSKLLKNVRRLTTPFDLHETLKDLVNPSVLTHEYLRRKEETPALRGRTLFSEISPERTCESADIAAHWCTCQTSTPIDVKSKIILAVSMYTVQYMNSLLIGYAQCDFLVLKEIKNAQIMTHNDDIKKGSLHFEDYTITIQTVPGDGVFEATVRHDLDVNKFNILGTISRLNLYGKQSLCMTDFHLKLYCYCKNIIN